MTSPKPDGSFRGVPFYSHDNDTIVGRRQPVYSVPFSDKGALHTDLGRAPRRYSFTIFALGDDVDDQVKALIDAFEQGGAGLLTHPDIGRKMVVIGDDISIHRNTDAGRKAEIRFRAVEAAEKPPAGGGLLDKASALKRATKLGRDIAGASFSNPVTGLLKKVSDFVAKANLDVLDDVLNDMHKINGAIAAVLSVPSGFADQIDGLSRAAAQLLSSPRRLFDSVSDVLDRIAQATRRVMGPQGLEGDVLDVTATTAALSRTVGAYGSLYAAIDPMAALGSGVPAVPAIDTPERDDQRQCQNALLTMLRAAALFSCADAAADARYDSAAQARLVRDKLSAALADLADGEPEVPVDLANALKDVAAALIAHLTELADGAIEITSYTPPDTLPVEVLAWTLYADAERSDEIVARNPSIVHPSFVQGRVALEVKAS